MVEKDLLNKEKENRIEEIAYYQFNIDNYKIGLELLEQRQDPDLIEFKSHLEELLRTSIIEQKKSQTILDAINIRLGT